MDDRNYSVTGHMVVKNEDRWIWFAVLSVIDYLDKLIIFDTGSIDHTNDIIENLLKNESCAGKISYEKIGAVKPEDFYKVRQRQIDMTDTDYFMVIDGDEIWYQDSLMELDRILTEKRPLLVATRFINVCGDVFHYRFDERETYCINGITGAITIRVYSTAIPGISCGGVYGVEGYIDADGIAVQEKGYSTEVMSGKYLHTSLLNRSSAQRGDFSIKYRRAKLRADWDAAFDGSFRYPEVFYAEELPRYVKSPFQKDSNIIRITWHWLRKIKRFVKYGR